MTSTSKRKYRDLKVIEPVSVTQASEDSSISDGWRVLIMGPTGAGKSSFIEALGLKGTSRISSNGLDGCTQLITAYRLNNVTRLRDDRRIYLVDSPGFADSKISEMSIVTMLQTWIIDNGDFIRILYFTPITAVRLPGSQQRVLKTFQALSGVKGAPAVTIVTTMWDNIWGEGPATRAEKTYEQLHDGIWKDFLNAGAQIARFYNTEESALFTLDDAFGGGNTKPFSIEDHRHYIKGSPFANNLLTDIQNRIENMHSHIPTLQDELAHAEAQGDKLLVSTIRLRLQEAENDLTRFKKEHDDFNRLPAPSHSASPSVLTRASEASGTTPQEDARNSVQELTQYLSVQPSVVQSVPQQQLDPAPHAPGRFARILDIMKCWGDAVGERHVD
ncbi:hypothetical protein BJ165DRAFT_1614232 [Panaeolus papilionaceus]|nr:hypothetical protein BJ165DRAFT_1614232 [Panaeolus papilionaceus]